MVPIFVVIFLRLTRSGFGGDNGNSFFVWQGFEATWLRKLGKEVEVPHRLGSFRNYISYSSNSSNASISFTPGVDGDYAYPNVHYRKGFFLRESLVMQKRDTVSMHWKDECVNDVYGNPVANSTFVRRVSWDLWNGDLFNYELVLSGFELEIECIPEHQPPDHKCSKSNAMWPYSLSLKFTDCCKNKTSFFCELGVQIVRGDSPHPGKPLEFSLDFHLNMHVLLLSGEEKYFQSYVYTEGIHGSDSIHDSIINGSISIPNHRMQETVVGMRGFSFKMLETDGRTELGRYFGSLVFHVGDDPSPSKTKAETKIFYDIGIRSGSTVYDSKIQYSLYPVLLEFGKGVVSLEKKVGGFVSCPVCFSADVFFCKLVHLNDTNSCFVENL